MSEYDPVPVLWPPEDAKFRFDVVFSPERLAGFRTGVEAAIAVIEERGKRLHNAALQPHLTVREIRERLLSEETNG